MSCNKEMNLLEWEKAFEANKDATDSSTACKLGFYDWFSSNKALMGKIRRMAPMVKRVIKSGKVDPTKTYVFFKNNCPMIGQLYDSFSICDIETGDVIYWVSFGKNAELIDVKNEKTLAEGSANIRKFFTAQAA